MTGGRSLVVAVTVRGDPASKARARFTGYGYPGQRVYTPERTREAEDAIGWEIRAKCPGLSCDSEHDFYVEATFYAKGWHRRDIDNMAKLVLDACNKIVWADDSQVTGLQLALYRGVDDPRTEIAIYAVDPQRRPHVSCERCGKVTATLFPSVENQRKKQRFCAACWSQSRDEANVKTCPTCETTFIPPTRKRSKKFCSPACVRWPGATPWPTDDPVVAAKRAKRRDYMRRRKELDARGVPRDGRHETCHHGHPLTSDNLYIRPNGMRECRTCLMARRHPNTAVIA